MPFVQWEAKYQLGVEQFDVHHKHLVDLLNQAHQMFLERQGDDQLLKDLLVSLTEYAGYHFELEETWMKQVEYPKFEEHLVQHKSFIYKLCELNSIFNNDRENLALEVIVFLRHWLLDHILKADAKYGAYVRTGHLPKW